MLETMLALKNNDMRKIPGYDPEPVEKLRKLQRALVSDTLFWFVLGLYAILTQCDSGHTMSSTSLRNYMPVVRLWNLHAQESSGWLSAQYKSPEVLRLCDKILC